MHNQPVPKAWAAHLRLGLMVKVQADPLTLVPGLHDPGFVFLTGPQRVFCLQLLIKHVRQVQEVVCITLSIGLLCFTERPAQDMYLSDVYIPSDNT